MVVISDPQTEGIALELTLVGFSMHAVYTKDYKERLRTFP